MADKAQLVGTRNRRTLVVMSLLVAGMIGLSFASVPLYEAFCRITGYGGTTQQSSVNASEILARRMVVRFDASVNNKLGWQFSPLQPSVDLAIGETGLAYYQAENKTDAMTVGMATFNVTPQKAGQYFVKTECFCFTEQQLQPHERVEMPVAFYIDPAIADGPNMNDVHTVTLSYTFFPKDPEG